MKARWSDGRTEQRWIKYDMYTHLVDVQLALTPTQLFVAGGEFPNEVVAEVKKKKLHHKLIYHVNQSKI